MVSRSCLLEAAALVGGLSLFGCGFEWEAAYGARFGRGSQGGTPSGGAVSAAGETNAGGAGIAGSIQGGSPWLAGGAGGTSIAGTTAGGDGPTGGAQILGGATAGGATPGGTGPTGGATELGGASAGGATPGGTGPTGGVADFGGASAGGATSGGTGPTGGVADLGGASAAGGFGGVPPCTENLVINAGFESVVGDVPANWTGPTTPSTKGRFSSVDTLAAEGARSLLVDTMQMKTSDDPLVVTSMRWKVQSGESSHLRAAGYATDPANPVRVAVIYYGANAQPLDALMAAPALVFYPPMSGFAFAGPEDYVAPAGADSAGVAVIAGSGVSAHVDAVCVTR